MDIGVTYSSNPARLIQQSGQYLSQNIREIGQQVQGTILELNTRKDIGRMAQNLSTLNVQSDAFPIQAAQVFAQHPLAAQDGRGQMVLKALGQAHHDWRQSQLAINRFNSPVNVPGVGLVNRSTGEVITEAPTKPVAVGPQSRLVDPKTGDVLVEPLPVEDKGPLYGSSPQGIFNRKTGEVTSPAPAKGLTPYQQEQLKRGDRKAVIDAIKTEITELDKNILSGERAYKDSMAAEQKATDPGEKARHASDWSAVGQLTDELKKKKQERIAALQEIAQGEADLGLPAVKGKITKEEAQKFLDAANGDREKARAAAKAEGWEF